MYAINRIH